AFRRLQKAIGRLGLQKAAAPEPAIIQEPAAPAPAKPTIDRKAKFFVLSLPNTDRETGEVSFTVRKTGEIITEATAIERGLIEPDWRYDIFTRKNYIPGQKNKAG
ncbi:hypothetical protein LCGC14_1379030, partial [marine sediment metagenome]